MAYAVDACLETIDAALREKADVLFVHHGLFWGKPLALTGSHYERVRRAFEGDLALYAAHLPLDAHPVVGNNARIADTLGMVDREPFASYHGVSIGIAGRFEEERSLEEIFDALKLPGNAAFFPFGRKAVRSAAIVSGGGSSSIYEAARKSYDLFITGEVLHQVYHTALEEHVNMISGGHYATEVYGPTAVGKLIEKELGIETCFIDIPTGL